MVASAADRLPLRNGRSEPTGTYLGELVEPTDAMLSAGFQLSFATPGARIPTIDDPSCSLMYFGLSRSRREQVARQLRTPTGTCSRTSDLTAAASSTASADCVLDLFAGVFQVRLELFARTAVLEIAVTGGPANGFLRSATELLQLVAGLVGRTHGESSSVRHGVPAEDVGLHQRVLTVRDEGAAHHRARQAQLQILVRSVAAGVESQPI